jgi:hypothetical protein
MIRRILFVTAMGLAVPAVAQAQSVELVYTPSVLSQTVALRDSLKVSLVHSSNALPLVGAPSQRKADYGRSVERVTAVVILGEDALKAVADIEFAAAVIVANAKGPTSARGRIIRVFDGSTPAPAGTIVVTSMDVVRNAIKSEGEVSLKGPLPTVVQAIVTELR